MANNPFDQRIINQLERPTSSDLNIAQGQINANVRAFARQLLQSTQSAYASGTGPGGALGNSFIIRAAAAPSLTEVTMTRGVGFASFTPSIENIGGITGLSTNLDYPVIYSQDRVLDLSGVAAPAAGTCRRDVIALRAIGQSDLGLTDQGETDIYEPMLEAFQSASRFKTLTADLTNQNLQVIESTDTPTGALVYIKGAAVPYVNQYSLPSAPITTAGTGAGPYINIAIINRYAGQTEINESDIVDYRLIASPGGQLTITGSATVGSNGLDGPGTNLTGVTIKAPPGIKAAIYKLGANSAVETNSYALIVAGPRGIASANMTCTLGMPGGDYTALTTLLPSQVITSTQSLNLSAGVAMVELLADPSKVSPVQTIAVGQPHHVFRFSVGTIENVMELVTAPVTVTGGGSITIGNPPGYPAMYPAGTYDVAGNTDTRTYYLNYGTAADVPTTALPSPTYQLGVTPSASSLNPSVGVDTTWERKFGFVVSPTEVGFTIPTGVWKITLLGYYSGSAVQIKAKAYMYNGSTNPESGTLLDESSAINLPDSNPDYIDFYLRIGTALPSVTSRIYIAIYAVSSTVSTAQFYFNDNRPAILETNIPTAAPTVTIPNSTTNYPAATYPVTGSAGTVSFSIPTQYPKFNPETIRFRVDDDSPDIITRTIPVNFTVTLNRS